MKTFSFDKSKKYLIYGAGGNANHLIKLLNMSGYKVCYVIDRRAEEIGRVEEVPVITLGRAIDLFSDEKGSCTIVVTIKNVFEHVNIARSLIENGFENIIYKPYGILQGESDPEWESINVVYESLLEKGVIPDKKNSMVAISRLDHLLIFRDEFMVSESETEVFCFVPTCLVCNYDRNDAYRLIPMEAFYPILDIYRFLNGFSFTEEWEKIVENFYLYSGDWLERTDRRLTQGLRDNMINSRIDVFNEMQRKTGGNGDFFKRNAVRLKRNGSRFALKSSGRNRVSFMITEGNYYIPAYIDKDDYETWVNTAGMKRFRKYMEKAGILSFFSPIPHPHFSNLSAKTWGYERIIGMSIIERIYKALHEKHKEYRNDHYNINLEDFNAERASIRICIAARDEGGLGRLFLFHDFKAKRLFYNSKEEEVSEELDALLSVEEPEGWDERCADILIYDTRFDNEDILYDFTGKKIFLIKWDSSSTEVSRDYCDRSREMMLVKRTIMMKSIVSLWENKEGI